MPNNIIAMPTATSFTRGRLHNTACTAPRNTPQPPAASTPSQGLPLRYDTPYALTAPSSNVPSKPRLMRPLFSVSVSPKLTNKYGVLTRIIPPNIASGTPQIPKLSFTGGSLRSSRRARRSGDTHRGLGARLGRHVLRRPALRERLRASHVGFAGQDDQEQDALEHIHGCIGQIVPALQQSTAGFDTTHQHGHDQDGERMLARHERHQHS